MKNSSSIFSTMFSYPNSFDKSNNEVFEDGQQNSVLAGKSGTAPKDPKRQQPGLGTMC